MLKHRRESRLIHVLVCWKCDGRTGPNHYALEGGGATCSLCGSRNPLGNLRRVPLGVIHDVFEIIVCFIPSRKHDESVSVMALHSDCKTVLGPWVHVGSDATMIRVLTYLGCDARTDCGVRGLPTTVGPGLRERIGARCQP